MGSPLSAAIDQGEPVAGVDYPFPVAPPGSIPAPATPNLGFIPPSEDVGPSAPAPATNLPPATLPSIQGEPVTFIGDKVPPSAPIAADEDMKPTVNPAPTVASTTPASTPITTQTAASTPVQSQQSA